MEGFIRYRTYLIWGFVAVGLLIIVGTLAYSLFFRGDNTTAPEGGAFPAGEGRTTGTSPNSGTTDGESAPSDTEDRLFQMHDKPVVSSVSFMRAGYPYARFMEEGSGHVYEYDLRNRREYRISNTSIPQITEALWSTDGTAVAFRYEDGGVMKAAVGELGTTTEERAFLKVHFLPEGIQSLALSPNGRSIFYIIKNQPSGGALGITANRDGSSPKTIFSSKLSHWLASWPAANTILVSSPWSLDGGLAYQISAQSGSSNIVYSTSGAFAGISGGPRGELLVTDPSTGYISTLTANGSPDPTIAFSWPSLCSFSSGASSTAVCADVPQSGVRLFEAWSRGEYDFTSSIALLDFSNGMFRFVLTEQERLDRLFDVTSPTVSPDGNYVTFVNRVDGLLWGVLPGLI